MVILILIFNVFNLNAQFFDDFSDLEILSNPTWTGDVSDFVVNSEGQLQLMSSGEGKSSIFSNMSPLDSMEFSIDYKMDFSPSASNYLRIFFGLDNVDITIANGYFFRIGENGSDDAIEVYKLTNGIETLIGRGTVGAAALDPSAGQIQLTLRFGNTFVLSVDYGNTGVFSKEIEWIDNDLNLNTSMYLGVECDYTTSRADKFFFDNIEVSEYEVDLSPPLLDQVIVINDSELNVVFSEPILTSSIDPNMISVDNGIGFALTANNGIAPNILALTFDSSFGGESTYELFLKGIADLSGNAIAETSVTFKFAAPAIEGEIVLSEILFNPYTNGSDFIELYNNSEKLLSTTGLIIQNRDKSESKPIPLVTIEPGAFLAITEDKTDLISVYNPIIINDNIIEADLPAFNNDSGNISLTRDGEVWSESFDYDESHHNTLLDDVEGVSLERLSYESDVSDISNWYSSASTNLYATPGYKNSNSINISIENGISLESSKITPNNDGINDVMRLIYKLENPNNTLNLSVYDSNGFKVKQLASSQLIGTDGIIIWDANNDQEILVRLGIYIIVGNITRQKGDTIKIKEVVSVVDRI
jgi:hypothetical protein